MKDSFETARERYPGIPELDLHYYGIKGYGIRDDKMGEGRPKFHFIKEKLFSAVPLISSEASPYELVWDVLLYNGKELPFKVKFIGRIARNPAYFYYRGIQEWMPTLDSETILSVNFQPVCRGCDWCCREIEKGMRNISPEQGVRLLQENGVDLSSIDKMTFVTGMYRDGEEVVKNILETVGLAKKQGFRGRVLYIGSQISGPSLAERLVDGLEETFFKYAFTIETFSKRDRMHAKKSFSLEEALSVLAGLRSAGVDDLEYSYMPGLDSLAVFDRWMPEFSGLARPHLSIFRPAEQEREGLKDPEFFEDPVGYLCHVRLAFEKQHGGPVYQNNLASLWGFPLDRINSLFLTDKTSLG